MKYLNKIASSMGIAAVGIMMLTACEGGDIYSTDSPDWLQDKIDSIANAKDPDADVYTFGETDFSSGWWTAFSKTYVIPDGAKWTAKFNLHINPSASNTYKNFALILTNDSWSERNGTGYTEYGAIRFDYQIQNNGNSEWGTYIDRSGVTSNLEFFNDTDAGIEKLGGEVTLTVDRSPENSFIVTMTNGTVTKTYTQNTALTNLNTDPSDENIRCFIAVEGSYIDFESSHFDQIRTTSTPDQQPVSMVLNNVPKKVLTGSDLNTALANVSATVTYDGGGTRNVPASDLVFVAVPDLTTAGTKTIIAICNKTFKEQNADTPIVAQTSFSVVDKMCDMLGAADNSTAWWGAHSPNVKVNPKETVVSSFYNYTSGGGNWNNFVVVLCKADNTEYGVVRADNYGWVGDKNTAANPDMWQLSGGQTDWAAWLKAMDGAKVTTYVTNNGDGTADVEAIMEGTDGNTYTQSYKGIAVSDPDDFYYRYTVDNCHLEFSDVIGDENNTTGWWGAHSENIKIPAGYTVTRQFLNYTSGSGNWNNWVAVLCKEDNTEYGVVRADNYGWVGDKNTAANPNMWTLSGGQSDWASWLKAMDEAKVTVSVTNDGNGTADVNAVMIGNDGNTYTQYYKGITVDPADCYFRFTVDNCHLVFEPSARTASSSSAKRNGIRRCVRR